MDQRRYTAAFTPWNPNGCARYLMDAVASLDPGATFGLVNANDVGVNLVGVLASLDGVVSPRIVALGRQADAVLTRVKLTHGAVPHPQYVRRFRYHDQADYAREIEEAAGWWN